MEWNNRVRPAQVSGLCPVCAGSGMMPRSAPEHVRVPCEGCGASGVLA